MIRVLFDTNVILDIALARKPFAETSLHAFEQVLGMGTPPMLAPHSLSTFYYLVRQSHGNQTAQQAVADLLSTGQVATFDADCAQAAVALNFADFEDAMVAACAQANHAELILTRNLKDYTHSPIEVCSPETFLKRMKKY